MMERLINLKASGNDSLVAPAPGALTPAPVFDVAFERERLQLQLQAAEADRKFRLQMQREHMQISKRS